MAEINTPGKPIMHSSTDALKRAVDAKNASQKADLMFEGVQHQKDVFARLKAVEKMVEGFRQRLERLEAEDGVVIPWSSEDGK